MEKNGNWKIKNKRIQKNKKINFYLKIFKKSQENIDKKMKNDRIKVFI